MSMKCADFLFCSLCCSSFQLPIRPFQGNGTMPDVPSKWTYYINVYEFITYKQLKLLHTVPLSRHSSQKRPLSILLERGDLHLRIEHISGAWKIMSSSVITYNTRSSNSKRKKRVRFHRDTILDDSDHIALTITRHSFIYDKGYTQYFIKVTLYFNSDNFFCCYLAWALTMCMLNVRTVALPRGGVDIAQKIQRFLQFTSWAYKREPEL